MVQLGGPIGPFLDNVQQRGVPVDVFGTCEYRGPGAPNPQMDQHVQMQMLQAIKDVIGQKMAGGQLTFRDLGTGNIAQVIPEIINASGLAQQGFQIGNMTLQFRIDGHMPAAHPPAQAPQGPQHIVEARINVGGLRIDARSDRGVDTQGLQNQLKDKAKSEVTWWAIGCGVLLVVGIGLLGLGFYIWRNVKAGMSGAPTAATASRWDGKSAFSCAGGDSVVITGVKAKLSGTAVTAGGNCALSLVNVDVTADTAIEANGNAKVTVTGGSLSGSTLAVKAGANAKVIMTGTHVTGKTQATANATITGP